MKLTHYAHQWLYYPVVKAIQAMRGVRLLVAAGVIAELGDLSRFDHSRKLMNYLGLVPSEQSSGGKRHIGAITKCGNGRARRLLLKVRTHADMPLISPLICKNDKKGYQSRLLISHGKHN